MPKYDNAGRPKWGTVRCADGFSMSVQASQFNYCNPRSNTGPWESVEVGLPSAYEHCLQPYAENPDRPTETVYGWVPNKLTTYLLKKLNPIPVFGTSYCFTIAFFVWGIWSFLLVVSICWYNLFLAFFTSCAIIGLTIISLDLKKRAGSHHNINHWQKSSQREKLISLKKNMINQSNSI